MPCLKRWCMEEAVVEEDRLMSLPPEILDIILVRVPFKPLARTCCLSGTWRHRWESVRFLDI
uniref:F-box domain-containing protein n=1 Tax=Leersia perrieri TaxID=77586 RepID=A0A0D9X5U5_9ORYZ